MTLYESIQKFPSIIVRLEELHGVVINNTLRGEPLLTLISHIEGERENVMVHACICNDYHTLDLLTF